MYFLSSGVKGLKLSWPGTELLFLPFHSLTGYGNVLSSLEQGKKLQHFLLEGVAKCTSFVS